MRRSCISCCRAAGRKRGDGMSDVIKDVLMGKLFGTSGTSSGGGSSGGEDEKSPLDALIEDQQTEISSNAALISDYAFYRKDLTKGVFPLAESIGNYAFEYAVYMKEIECPSVKSVGQYAFRYTTPEKIYMPCVESFDKCAMCMCYGIVDATFPNAVSIGEKAFSECTALEKIELPLATTFGINAFSQSTKLRSVKLQSATTVRQALCTGCASLQTADFLVATKVEQYAFNNCYSLTALILRSNSLCSLSAAIKNAYHLAGTVDATYNPDGLADGYIYVPAALVDTYKAATNWSTFADQFRALEDYTVDGTTTGELDESKI